MRIAATADLHFTPANQSVVREQFSRVRDEADVLVLAGDLTNYGQPAEMEPLINAIVRLRVPTIAVLGNHDYESGRESELMSMLTAQGIKVLDGSSYERDGVGFAGTKAFVGGFGSPHGFWRARD
jgi:3',5'-cyclic AMP phosphodiesterase CpdA